MTTAGSDPTFVSLFSGAGGFDLGLTQAGFRCLAAYESDPSAAETYSRNVSKAVTVTPVSSTSELSHRGFDLLVAGPPCQGFSTIGRLNPKDARNRLFGVVVHAAVATMPRAVLIENVPAAWRLSSVGTSAERQLRRSGYAVQTVTLCASSYGVAQRRKRSFLIALRDYEVVPYLTESNAPPVTLADALQGIDTVSDHNPRELPKTSTAYQIACHIKPGQKLCDVRAGTSAVPSWEIPEVFGRVSDEERHILEALRSLRRRNRVRDHGDGDPVPEDVVRLETGRAVRRILKSLRTRGYVREITPGVWDLRRTFNGKYRRLSWSDPANCVLTKFCTPQSFLHPDEHRAFTVREAARLQGFDDGFVFFGTASSKAAQVGNAVPPPMGRYLGSWLRCLIQ